MLKNISLGIFFILFKLKKNFNFNGKFVYNYICNFIIKGGFEFTFY